MKKEMLLTTKEEIASDIINSIKKMTNGKISYRDPYITLDNITAEESEHVLKYLKNLIDFRIDMDLNYYTDEELMGFDFFYCTGQRKPDTGIDFIDFEFEMNGNASFDYTSYCPICKDGLKQISLFVVKGLSKKYASKKIVTPFRQYWVVNSEFMEKIRQQNISGVDFWKLLNYKGEASKTNFQMKPTRVLKNVLNLKYVKFPDKDCNCKNIGVGIPDITVRLHKETKNSLLDFNELYERNSSRTNGMYIISKKLLCIFIAEGIMPHRDIGVKPAVFV